MSASPVRYGEHPKIPQDAVCSICGDVEQLITDHCHEHGWVRGIVCPRCNVYLALIDRLITPKAQDLLALITHAARCPDCPAIAIDDLSPTSSLRSLGGSRPSVLGRIKVRLSPEMHNSLVDMAERKRRSMNGQVEVYIEEGLARDGLNGSADPFRAPVAAKSPTATELAGMLADAMDRWPEAFGPRARDMAEDIRFVLLGIGNRTDTTGEPA